METAIKVLRQAGYYSHAVYLAEKHAHHEWYLKIQLEDIKVRYYCSHVLTGVNIASLASCIGGNLISLACLHSSLVATGLFRQYQCSLFLVCWLSASGLCSGLAIRGA